MSFWLLLGMVLFAGAIGGFIGSFTNGKPSVFVGNDVLSNGGHIFVPGYIFNTLVGAVAAGVSWLLYGPLSQTQIGAASGTLSMAASTLGGALLVGMVGSAWLTKASGQKLLQAATFNAALAPQASPDEAAKLMTAAPNEALQIAKDMRQLKVPDQLNSRNGAVLQQGSLVPNSNNLN